MSSLDVLAREAMTKGWTTTQGQLSELLAEALALGWTAVPIRKGDPPLGTLKVVRAEDARKRSLSAMVGHGQQPLHTDGAHHREMPDIVMLASSAPSATPTLLCDPGAPTSAQLAGLFKVSGGRGVDRGSSAAFYASAVDSAGRWRYDPGCMTAVDDLARTAARELEDLASSAVEHHWREPDTVLVIANRRVLHARAAATDPETRLVYRVAFISRLEP